jgi:DNA-binding transcriptional ArsR family regulator
MDDYKVLDSRALKALAHPLRVQLYELLARDGAATATRLAKALDETSGATSYHLRQLHRAGLIQEDPDRGTARERWWRPAQRALRLVDSALPDEPGTQAAARWLAADVQRRRNQWVERWYDEHRRWSPAWQDASMTSGWQTRMTVEQLAALRDEVYALIERHIPDKGAEPDDGEPVAVLFYAFPQTTDAPAGDHDAS